MEVNSQIIVVNKDSKYFGKTGIIESITGKDSFYNEEIYRVLMNGTADVYCTFLEHELAEDKENETDCTYLERELTEKNLDVVNHPSHYTQGKIECIQAMEEALGIDVVMSFCKGNAFKYIWRASLKNGIEDMKKAKWYIDKYIELFEKKES